MRQIALTAIGEDRPGIVAAVCRRLYEAGGNLRDTSMTIVSGQFAMILVVSVPLSLDLADLRLTFEPVSKELGIEIIVKELADLEHRVASTEADCYLVQVMGADRPGIVYRFAEVMARHSINITDVETRVAGEEKNQIYVVLMEVSAPPGMDMPDLERELAELGREMTVEVTVRPMDPAAL